MSLTNAQRRAIAGLAAIALVPVAALLGASPAAAGGGSFRVTYEPPLSEVEAQANPDSPKTPTTITVQALGADRRPVRDARIQVTLTAPDPPAIAGSDVPRIEGRELVHTSFGAPDGRQSFATVLPIRGAYRLDLRASPLHGATAAFAPFRQATSFHVNERRGELRNLILALLGLGMFSAISAAVMARPQMRRRLAANAGAAAPDPGRVLAAPGIGGAAVVLGLLLVVYLGSLVLDSATAAEHDRRAAALQGPGKGLQRTASSPRAALRYNVDRSSQDGVSVQTLVRTEGSLLNPRTAKPLAGGDVRIEARDRETGMPAFTMQEPAAAGRFRWDFDYWDGVEYDTTVAAVPAAGGPRFASVGDTVRMAVQPLSPPLVAKFVGLAYLLLPVIAGMALGVVFARRRWRSVPPARPAPRGVLTSPLTR
ncbi:MAG TPA: hypothetical protein VMY78_09040 [Solirubrobacteraceae bacterium]|nr:hypothetical protein [Solirubrobacteraceae bacterium]